MLYEHNVNLRFKSKWADELSVKLRKLMIVYQENLYHTQELQKRAHNKATKPRSYVSSNKIWLNSIYMKTKQNQKLEVKFFGLCRVLHPVNK